MQEVEQNKKEHEEFIESEIKAGDTNLTIAYRIGLKVGEAKQKFESSEVKKEQPEDFTAYDEMSVLHDWIAYQMEAISQIDMDKNAFQLGRYRAFRAVLKTIENQDGDNNRKLRDFYFEKGEQLKERIASLEEELRLVREENSKLKNQVQSVYRGWVAKKSQKKDKKQ